MLDINLIRNNPDLVRQNIRKRFQENKIKILDDLIKQDHEFLKLKKEIEDLRHKKN